MTSYLDLSREEWESGRELGREQKWRNLFPDLYAAEIRDLDNEWRAWRDAALVNQDEHFATYDERFRKAVVAEDWLACDDISMQRAGVFLCLLSRRENVRLVRSPYTPCVLASEFVTSDDANGDFVVSMPDGWGCYSGWLLDAAARLIWQATRADDPELLAEDD